MSDEKRNFRNRSNGRRGFDQCAFDFNRSYFVPSKILFCLCLVLVGSFSIYPDEQDRRYDSKNLYDPPSVKITEQDLNDLRRAIQDPSKDAVSEIQKVLDRYYSQFIDSRRIEEEKTSRKNFRRKDKPKYDPPFDSEYVFQTRSFRNDEGFSDFIRTSRASFERI